MSALLEQNIINTFNKHLAHIQSVLQDHVASAPAAINAILNYTSVTTVAQAQAIHNARVHITDPDLVITGGKVENLDYFLENFTEADALHQALHRANDGTNDDNITFVSLDGRYEVVIQINEDGEYCVVDDPAFTGHGNYALFRLLDVCDPLDYVLLDLNPWVLWGNEPSDPTTPQDREARVPDFAGLPVSLEPGGDNGLELLCITIYELFITATITRSPLVLDLDGDGIETVDRCDAVFFDHDANGFAESTGWVENDDGLLAIDLDGNGQIDTGRELFGSETELGADQNAENGFEALAAYDTNNDGVVNASDAQFSELRIWQDKNYNGTTEAGELITLAEAGVASLSLTYTDSDFVDANKNEHRQMGSYTTTNGQTRDMVDVWFDTDTAFSIDRNPVDVPADIAALPNLLGFGNVASLHAVMAGSDGAALRQTLNQLTATTDASTRDGLMDDLLFRWAGVYDIAPDAREATQIYGNAIGDARKLAVLEKFLGYDYIGVWCWGELDPNPHGPAADILLDAYQLFKDYASGQLLAQTTLNDELSLLDFTWNADTGEIAIDAAAFVAEMQSQFNANATTAAQTLENLAMAVGSMGDRGEAIADAIRALGDVNGSIFARTIATFGETQTRGGAGNDRITGEDIAENILGLGDDDVLTGNGGNDFITGGTGDDRMSGGDGNDRYIFNRGDGDDTINNYDRDDSTDTLQFGNGITPDDITISRSYYDLILTVNNGGGSIRVSSYLDQGGSTPFAIDTITFENGAQWSTAYIVDVLNRPTQGDDFIQGDAGANIINALGGNDDVTGAGGNDTLRGGDGNDRVLGEAGNDKLFGDAGRDVLQGGIGNDELTGGAGDDRLSGGVGSDTYKFSLGWGDDRIDNRQYDETNAAKWDRIVFDATVDKDDLTFQRNGNTLVITHKTTGDSISISSQFPSAYNPRNDGIQQIVFADGTKWTEPTIAAKTREGTQDRDYLIGSDGNDTLNGLGGNDSIDGGAGNDTLNGGADRDYIVGGIGDDRITGGTGDDNLTGGDGADIYVYALGDGKDTLNNYEYPGQNGVNGYDQIHLGAGITEADVSVSREGSNAILTFADGGTITIRNHFSSELQQIDRILFADGTRWFPWKLEQLAQQGSPGNDTLVGDAGNNILRGGAGDDRMEGGDGNDTLYGDADNDRLDGEAGNDSLYGGAGIDQLTGGTGNDKYYVNLGDGQTFINNIEGYGGTAGDGFDQLILGAGISQDDFTVSRNGYSAVLTNDANGDVIFLGNQFLSEIYQLDRIVFADGTIWYPWKIEALARQGSNGDDDLRGDEQGNTLDGRGGDDRLYGLGGDDVLIGGTGDDRIDGGLGNDSLYDGDGDDYVDGNAGNDTFYAGAGDDQLRGGNGNDTYRFDTVQGIKVIYDYAGFNQADFDQIIFGAGISADDITVSRIGNGLIMTLSDENIVAVENHFLSEQFQVGRVVFDDGTIWYPWKLLQLANVPNEQDNFITGTDANDTYSGLAGDDFIQGQGGNDTINGDAGDDDLYGELGNDTLIGGAGDDVLTGGTGNDTYMFNQGFGDDEINNRSSGTGAEDTDVIIFGAGISAADIEVTRSSSDIRLVHTNGTDRIEIDRQLNGEDWAIDEVRFDDGTVWTAADIATFALQGTSGNDYITGTNGADNIGGQAGNDRLYGYGGNDWFTPGVGSDSVYGSTGTDTVSFIDLTAGVSANLSDQSATSGGDTDFLDSIENITGSRYADNITGDDGANKLRGLGGSDWFNASEGADQYEGGIGSDMVSYVSSDQAVNINLATGRGTGGLAEGDRYDGIERITGSVHADYFTGSSGADQFRGLGGYDWFVGSGGGRDVYDGGTSRDTVSYGQSSSGVSASLATNSGTAGDASRDVYRSIENLTGSSHNDVLTGDSDRNVLRGLYGEDRIFGGSGADRITGGGSDDYIDGGFGYDYAYFSGNQNEYTISTQGAFTYVDRIASGGDGTDTLVNVEVMIFADGNIFV